MSGIRSRGRRGSTAVPNWRWEDLRLDPFDLRVAGWLASHADTYLAENVTRNEIVRVLGMSRTRVSSSIEALVHWGIIELFDARNSKGGGTRWVIIFDFDVWEREPGAGRHTSYGRTPDVLHVGRHTSCSIGEQEEGRDISKEISRGELEVAPERKRNEVFDALVGACNWDYAEMTDRQRRACGVATAELRRVGATPEEVIRRSVIYRRVFPNATLTPNALANQWAAIDREPDRAPNISRSGQALMRGYQRALEREQQGAEQ